MKKILVPTDFTPLSANSFRYALELAKQAGATIELLYIYNEKTIREMHAPDMFKEALRSGDAKVAGVFFSEYGEYVKYLSNSNVEVAYTLKPGNPSEKIQETGKKSGADLIVIGAWRAWGIQKAVDLLLGGVTTRVISSGDIPVMTVPSKLKYSQIRQLGVVCRQGEDVGKVLDSAQFFVRAIGSKATIIYLHTTENPQALRTLGNFEGPVHFLDEKDTINGLEKLVRENSIDTLLFPRKKGLGLMGKIFDTAPTKRMTYRTGLPLVSIPLY